MPAVPEPLGRRPGLRPRRRALRQRRRRGQLRHRRLRPVRRVATAPRPRRTRAATRRPASEPRDAADGRGRRACAQSSRRPAGEPVLLNGTVLRVDPATGAGARRQPARVAHATRTRGGSSPTACATRSGSPSGRARTRSGSATSAGTPGRRSTGDPTPTRPAELRLALLRGEPPSARLSGAGLNICSSLYSAGTATAPYFTYNHAAPSSPATPVRPEARRSRDRVLYGCNYPAFYNGGLFFSDYARKCIWFMPAGTNGLPDPTQIQQFDVGAPNPVDLEVGPNGDIFYPDIFGGTIHEISYSTGPSDLARDQPATASSSETGTTTL